MVTSLELFQERLSAVLDKEVANLQKENPDFVIIPNSIQAIDITAVGDKHPSYIFRVRVKLLKWDDEGQVWEAGEK